MDLPIPFSASMMRANYAGTKLQTRRSIAQPTIDAIGCHITSNDERSVNWDYFDAQGNTERVKVKYAVGDRLYCREHWRVSDRWDSTPPRDLPERKMTIFCEAGGSIANQSSGRWEPDYEYPPERPHWVGKLRQGMHMPKWASRGTCLVKGVKVERLQDISQTDAIAEGVEKVRYEDCHQSLNPEYAGTFGWKDYSGGPRSVVPFRNPIKSYASLWESINGAESWSKPIWVAVYSYDFVARNIFQL